jgi:cytoskeletal protein RodZ
MNKLILLIVSIGLIVFGAAFIADGIETKTVTATHLEKADRTAQTHQKLDNVDSAAKKSDSNSKEIGPKNSTDHASSEHSSAPHAARSNENVQSESKDGSDLEADANVASESSKSNTKSASAAGSEQQKAVPSRSSSAASRTSTGSGDSVQKIIHIEINGYDTKNSSGQVDFTTGMTAFSALKQLADRNGMELDYSGSGATSYIKSINGQRAGDRSAQSGWTYEVNGKEPSVSAGVCKLHDGDTVKWVYRE